MIHELLWLLSLGYLFLPVCLFFLGYCQWPVAVSGNVLLFAALCFAFQQTTHSSTSPLRYIIVHKRRLAGIAVAALVLLLLSGVGGYGSQDADWHKHNAILSALIERDWPLSYSFSISSHSSLRQSLAHVPLIYYIAYYLPVAIVGKLFGWFWANQALFLWTYLGLCLSLGWFLRLARTTGVFPLLIFAIFSGLDLVGIIMLRTLFLREPLHISVWDHIERWAVNWEYPAHITSLFWSPNQAICAWLLCGLLMSEFNAASDHHRRLFLLGLAALWSPFVLIGCVPFLITELMFAPQPLTQKLRAYFTLANVSGALLLIVIGLFYLSKMYPSPLPFTPVEAGTIFSSPVLPGLFFHEILALLVFFCLLEFGIFALLIRCSRLPLSPVERRVFLTSLIILSVLPFFRYGFWNDLAMRASLPALFFLAIFVTRAVCASTTPTGIRVLLILALAIGAMTGVFEWKRHIQQTYANGKLYVLPTAYPLYDIPKTGFDQSFFTQYIGSADSPFFKWVAKPLIPQDHPINIMAK